MTEESRRERTILPQLDDCRTAEIPSKEEQQALARLRHIKERVREIKAQMMHRKDSSGQISAQDLSFLSEELQRLKRDWDCWEKRREDAAHERMVRLGHERP
jgi:hypothetical protein